MKYIVYVKLKGELVPYYSLDKVSESDLIYVEDCKYPLKVIHSEPVLSFYDEDKLNSMKRVISKSTNDFTNEHSMFKDNKFFYTETSINNVFSFIEYHTDCLIKVKEKNQVTPYSLFKELMLYNLQQQAYEKIKLEFIFSNDAFSLDDIYINHIEPKSEINVYIPFLNVDYHKLTTLKEKTVVNVRINLINLSNNLVESSEQKLFTLYPISQLSNQIENDYCLLAKYITSNVPSVKQITLNALKYHKKPLIGYQNKNHEALIEEAKSIYLALHEWGINYQNPPSSTEYYQRIRMPEEVLKDKKGTCLDLSLLYCACLEEVGIHPLLILTSDHALAGFFLEETISLPYNQSISSQNIYNLAFDEDKKIIIVETTSFVANEVGTFNQAIYSSLAKLKDYKGKFHAIDINLCHQDVYTPIPTYDNDINLESIVSAKTYYEENYNHEQTNYLINSLNVNEIDRFTTWERKLLDLSERNPLVNLNLKTSNSIKLASLENIPQLLKTNDSLTFICPRLEEMNMTIDQIEFYFKESELLITDIYTNFPDNKILGVGYEDTIKKLIKKSNQAMDETGASTLYLCIGLLKYQRRNTTRGKAPFMVLPIKLVKEKFGRNYNMVYDYDNIMLNQTFFEYLKQEIPDIDFSSLYNISSDNNYNDIVKAFKMLTNDQITLDENIYYIANLTFAHYIMWQDMRNRKKELKEHPIINSIIENHNVQNSKISLELAEEKYEDFIAPLHYDSTQLKAIIECAKGNSFILDGPPGTGKSQTIVNMIVNAFYHGKTVLFVAEKKAALDVVANRLKRLGDYETENNLGRFCLELHSNKANKTHFFTKLKESMELGITKEPTNFHQTCEQLEAKKQILAKTINKLHEKKYYYSLYESIVKKTIYQDIPYYEQFPSDYLQTLSKENKETIDKLLEQYISGASTIEDFNHNVLKAFACEQLNFFDQEELTQLFNDTNYALKLFLEKFNYFLQQLNIKILLNDHNVNSMMKLINIALNEQIYLSKINKYFSNINDQIINETFNNTKIVNDFINQYANKLNIDLVNNIIATPIIEILSSKKKGLKGLFNTLKYQKLAKSLYLTKTKIKAEQLIFFFNQIKAYNDSRYIISLHSKYISSLIDDDYNKVFKDVEEIEKKIETTKQFCKCLKALNLNNQDFKLIFDTLIKINETPNPSLNSLYEELSLLFDNLKAMERKTVLKYQVDKDILNSFNDPLNAYLELLSKCSSNDTFNSLLNISVMNKLKPSFASLNTLSLINQCLKGVINYQDLKVIFDKSLVEGFIRLYFKDQTINDFNPSTFDLEVSKYKQLIDEYNALGVQIVNARLTKTLNHNAIEYVASSKIGKLKKTIATNGRGTSIRETLNKYGDVIKEYFPCFLMSPLSAAQYLEVDRENTLSKFDIVIFDEASQIPTHEAIGPIARGNSLIVAGDPEQMPPSAYFRAGVEIDESQIELVDADSLLDECLAIELPRIRLSYHYRSKHESLISFSNHNFYNDNLYTFPSPLVVKSSIEFKYVDLPKSKASSAISTEEITSICNTFKEVYTNPLTKDKSVGLIVFNMLQQEKVQDAINTMLLNDLKLAEAVNKAEEKTKEPFFIKSLENVQGDERDIIILSIGFRKNNSGKAVVVGSITRTNGQKRLNVAVTRSKEKMIIISTIQAKDFGDDAQIANKGQLMLKKFLRYAEGTKFTTSLSKNFEKQAIDEYIKHDLEQQGYLVDSHVGNSEFRVDLAIKSKDSPVYELGILIDSRKLDDNISLRDKLYVQENILNALKWRIINVYSIEYFKDPKMTINKIINALHLPYVKIDHDIDYNIEIDEQKAFTYNSLNYNYYQGNTKIIYTNDLGYIYSTIDILKQIIDTESPISFNTLKTRVKEHSNITSMSSKAKDRLEQLLNKMDLSITIDQTQKVYWKDDNHTLESFRTLSNRNIYDIPKEEIQCAMKQIINIQGHITNIDLFKMVLDVFGYGQGVLNKKNQERLEYVLNDLNNHL